MKVLEQHREINLVPGWADDVLHDFAKKLHIYDIRGIVWDLHERTVSIMAATVPESFELTDADANALLDQLSALRDQLTSDEAVAKELRNRDIDPDEDVKEDEDGEGE